jgi:hypothetical protein
MKKWPSLSTLVLGCAVITIAAYVYVTAHVNAPSAVGYEREWDWQLMFFAGLLFPIILMGGAAILFVWIFSRW